MKSKFPVLATSRRNCTPRLLCMCRGRERTYFSCAIESVSIEDNSPILNFFPTSTPRRLTASRQLLFKHRQSHTLHNRKKVRSDKLPARSEEKLQVRIVQFRRDVRSPNVLVTTISFPQSLQRTLVFVHLLRSHLFRRRKMEGRVGHGVSF